MPENQVSISYTPRVLDVWRASWSILLRKPARITILAAIPMVIGIAVAVLQDDDAATTVVLAAAYLAVFSFASLPISFLIQLRNRESRQWRSLSFNENGVAVKRADTESSYGWQTFERMRSGRRGYVLVSTEHRRLLWIPKSAFSSEGDEAEFRQLVASRQA